MEEHIRRLKYKLLEDGFMTEVRIKNELKRLGCESTDDVFEFLKNDPEIHKVRYANRFIAKYCTRDLYFYNPNYKKRTPKNKRKKKKK